MHTVIEACFGIVAKVIDVKESTIPKPVWGILFMGNLASTSTRGRIAYTLASNGQTLVSMTWRDREIETVLDTRHTQDAEKSISKSAFCLRV